MRAIILLLTVAYGLLCQPYPTPKWPEARSTKAADLERWLSERAGDHWAAVVIKDGRLIYSGHGPRGSVYQKNDCGSILKPLQGTVLGAALRQRRLKDIDTPAPPYWRDAHVTRWENDREITFRQFAQYRDRWNEPEPPGTYRYNNSSAPAAGSCIAGLFGRTGIAEVVREHIMKPIGADWDLWYWSGPFSDNASNPGPRMVLEASVYELAKLGYLWLRKGNWNGRRIFTEQFYREAVTDWSPDSGSDRFGFVGHYGYWWFVNAGKFWLPDLPEDTFYHIGNGDPVRATCLLVIQSWDTVAVLSMKRLSDEKKWDVILNSRVPSNEGPRAWANAVAALLRQ